MEVQDENKKDTKIRDELYRTLDQSLPKKLGLIKMGQNSEQALQNTGEPPEQEYEVLLRHIKCS